MTERHELIAVGGGPAALAAVRAFREAGGLGDVALITDEGRVPYHRPALTKELLRGVRDESELVLEDEFWFWKEGIAFVHGQVIAVDPQTREVALAGGRRLRYRSCVVATGAEPRRLSIPGADDPAVRVLRSLDDERELVARLPPGEPVVVIGSGFVGCELAASLRLRGHPVSLLSDEPAPNRRRLGPEASQAIESWLREAGVTLTLGSPVLAIERRDGELHVIAERGRARASTVVLAGGAAPRSEILLGRGVVAQDGAIPVDSSMRTRVPGLLAAGDVAAAENVAAGRTLRVEHWGDALTQGSIAGATAAGHPDRWEAVPGFWSTIGERTLKYAAWGDGYDTCRMRPAGDGEGFVVSYGRDGRLVGVLTHGDDEAYAQGSQHIREGASWTP